MFGIMMGYELYAYVSSCFSLKILSPFILCCRLSVLLLSSRLEVFQVPATSFSLLPFLNCSAFMLSVVALTFFQQSGTSV